MEFAFPTEERFGSFLLADGAVEVPYGERDVVLVWPEYMHAVIPPIAVSRIPARRMSYLHYTRRVAHHALWWGNVWVMPRLSRLQGGGVLYLV